MYEMATLYRVSTADPLHLIRLCIDVVPTYASSLSSYHPTWPSFSALFAPFAVISNLKREVVVTCLLALLLTLLRYRLQTASQEWMKRWKVSPRYSHRLPECIWKLGYYGISWILALYVHMYRVNTIEDPLSMWNDWKGRSVDNPPPYDYVILMIYAIQSAFYVHSIYATLMMDIWRADSWVMFIHHFVALALLMLSYGENYTMTGVFVLFLQDNSDAALEITKLCVYLKRREDGRYFVWLEKTGNLVLYSFALIWIVFRLYWFTTKLLYGAVYGGCVLGPRDSLSFPILGMMLVSILLLNLFWFNFIVRMVIRVLRTGEEPEDNREYDTEAMGGTKEYDREGRRKDQ